MSGGSDHGQGLVQYCVANCENTTDALTTTFSPPTTCTNFWTPVSKSSAWISAEWREGIVLTRNFTVTDCVPSQWVRCAVCPPLPGISPGVCPDGWPAASTAIVSDLTTHYCCPKNAPTLRDVPTCSGSIETTLLSLTYNTTSTYATSNCSFVSASSYATCSTYNTTSLVSVTSTTYAYGASFQAAPIIVHQKSGDIPVQTPALTTTSTLPPTGTGSQASETSPLSPTTSHQGGLSTSAKAGIGVGVPLGVCVIVALLFMLYLRRKQNASTGQWDQAELSNESVEPKELSNESPNGTEVIMPRELEVRNDPRELEAHQSQRS